MVNCGDKEKCCCCIPLWVGMILIGIVVSLEFALSGVLLVVRDPAAYIGDLINVLLKLCVASCFLWMACKPHSLLAR